MNVLESLIFERSVVREVAAVIEDWVIFFDIYVFDLAIFNSSGFT